MPLHPALVERFPLLDGITSISAAYADPVLRARFQEFERWPADDVPVVDTRELRVPGPHGDVPVRIYSSPQPVQPAPRPVLVWLHGGAFVGGDLDMAEADWTAREVAVTGVVVVSVDYRLCHDGVHFPVPHDDAVAALSWTRDHAAELGADPDRITVGGASAGGALAAGAALRVRDDDGWVPAALALVYPLLHASIEPGSAASTRAMTQVPGLFVMGEADRVAINENYLGGPLSSANGYALPGHGTLEGLCPALLLPAEHDSLRASAEQFAGQLARAGVDVTLTVVREVLHGFLNLPRSIAPVGRALDELARTVHAAGQR